MTDEKCSNKLSWMLPILDRYEDSLIRYARRITGDPDLAREVVQETFLRLCSQDRSKIDGYLGQWLYTVCRTRALDVIRKESRMRTLTDTQPQGREITNDDPAQKAESQEGVSQVLRVLSSLPESQQEVVSLRFQGGLSYKEIANVTGNSVTNVGYLIHVAIKVIREELGDVGS